MMLSMQKIKDDKQGKYWERDVSEEYKRIICTLLILFKTNIFISNVYDIK